MFDSTCLELLEKTEMNRSVGLVFPHQFWLIVEHGWLIIQHRVWNAVIILFWLKATGTPTTTAPRTWSRVASPPESIVGSVFRNSDIAWNFATAQEKIENHIKNIQKP